MTRDIVEYTAAYRRLAFEPIQAAYRRKRVLAEIERHQPARLLEVGCGHAPLFTDLRNMLVTVVEPSPVFAENARQQSRQRTDVRVVQAFIEDVPPLPDPMDMIIVSCLLHEVDDPQALLRAVRRLCSTETVVHVNVPNARSLHRLLAVAMGLISAPAEISETQRTMQQRATYDRDTLHAELERAGFAVQDGGSLFVKPFTHAQMQRLVEQQFLTPAMLDGFDRLVEFLPELGSELWVNAKVRDA
jgi:SAM-dependent methyltransferase